MIRFPRVLKFYNFSVHGQGNILLFRFHLKIFRCLEDMANVRAAGFGHQNLVLRILRAIKLYDFYVLVQGDLFLNLTSKMPLL